MDTWTYIGFGVVTGATMALPALGLALQVRVARFFNLAFGDLLTVGVALTLWCNVGLGLSLPVAALIGSGLAGGVGVVVHRLVFQPLTQQKTGSVGLLVASVGVGFVVRNVLLLTFGPAPRQFAVPMQKSLHLGPFLLTATQILLFALSVGVLLGVHILLRRTALGRLMRAVADNPELAELRGVRTERVVNYTWAVSTAISSLGGVFLGVLGTVSYDMGANAQLLLFTAIILGGVGNPYGAMAGAFVLGISMELAAVVAMSHYKLAMTYLVMVGILLLRPRGLFATSALDAR